MVKLLLCYLSFKENDKLWKSVGTDPLKGFSVKIRTAWLYTALLPRGATNANMKPKNYKFNAIERPVHSGNEVDPHTKLKSISCHMATRSQLQCQRCFGCDNA